MKIYICFVIVNVIKYNSMGSDIHTALGNTIPATIILKKEDCQNKGSNESLEEKFRDKRIQRDQLGLPRDIKENSYLNDDEIQEELLTYKRSLTRFKTTPSPQKTMRHFNDQRTSLSFIQSTCFPLSLEYQRANSPRFKTSFYPNPNDEKAPLSSQRQTKGNRLRTSYISKLLTVEAGLSKQKDDKSSLIIFDWDDTLLCSFHIIPNGLYHDDAVYSQKDVKYFAMLESTVHKLLTRSIQLGKTFIITNSVPGWVEYSVDKFYPSVLKLLSQLTVVSSRERYEALYPNNALQWKVKVFEDIKATVNAKGVNTILSFGDSVIEMQASQALASKYGDVFIKSIKLIERPSPIQLNKQLEFITKTFDDIVSTSRSFAMKINTRNSSYSYQTISS